MNGLVVVPIHHVERDQTALSFILNNCNVKVKKEIERKERKRERKKERKNERKKERKKERKSHERSGRGSDPPRGTRSNSFVFHS